MSNLSHHPRSKPSHLLSPLGSRGSSNPLLRRPPDIIESSNEEAPPKGPTIALLRKVNACLIESLVKTKDLSDNLNELRRGLGKNLARVARAAGVADALDQPF